MVRLILSRQNSVCGGPHRGPRGKKNGTQKRLSRRAQGSAQTLGKEAGVAVLGSTGTENTDVRGGSTQLHRRVFAPVNQAKLQKTLHLGMCLLGREKLFTNTLEGIFANRCGGVDTVFLSAVNKLLSEFNSGCWVSRRHPVGANVS